ncbi:hypothetical protein [Kribbella sp. ALI-6-A]|uniref:hypothetical protein n=1 Tax=Kribbella sp. ALI-6-A TaxID=1933817 RepID=UPI001EDAC6D2|nr:hypothetical protein [Kribbella sp. ALI-6-A]
MRRLTLPTFLLATAVLLTGCGEGGTNKGTMPEGVEDTSSTTDNTPGTPAPSSPGTTAEPSTPVTTPPAAKAQITVVPGNYASNPAVQGLVKKYPIYYKAQIDRNDSVIKETFPAYFYLDVTDNIKQAKSNGWVMRPPGSVVVMSVVQRPFGVVRLNLCLSQRTQYWKPKSRTWVKPAPQGLPKVIEMVETGMGWSMYREMKPDKPFSCAKVRFPA